MKTFVVAVDGSTYANDALGYAYDLASKVDAVVHVVHVAPTTEWAAIPGPAPPIRIPHTPNAADQRPLEEAIEIAREWRVPVKTELLIGDTVDEVVAYADSLDADLIIVGSRGRGALTGAVLGSVSFGVLHEAMRPVLVVRGEQAHDLSLAKTA